MFTKRNQKVFQIIILSNRHARLARRLLCFLHSFRKLSKQIPDFKKSDKGVKITENWKGKKMPQLGLKIEFTLYGYFKIKVELKCKFYHPHHFLTSGFIFQYTAWRILFIRVSVFPKMMPRFFQIQLTFFKCYFTKYFQLSFFSILQRVRVKFLKIGHPHYNNSSQKTSVLANCP